MKFVSSSGPTIECELTKMASMTAQIPTSFGHELRACLRCRLVKTYDQFRESGCENCPFFKIEEDQERVVDCTTPNFNGIISVMDSTRSWAARWLRIGMKICSWCLHSCCLRCSFGRDAGYM
ncbi:transcription elongation factor SPT4 homolog 2-like isoform X3 [Gastrolobium bilobum]|uniref:transcription elongation factor SPT4 homolog 2-like isoform X3 n=1 Tax=Gastrolobium bilobum TaxID=150636 RepID=UPI002AAF5F39|nr:transcription elongation factor SPT4 homolog 2-like isoform X3 [Gastrolobium bilobum]XP_061338246.1 transcription elongation factor SPT4 homolog 2-like isoform X3 [Gastrolobium bilobum]XP_061338247.1 transcription elongation factor SPT4 homolog 2-like isoform X3 [Gastrolobium bilobum]